MRKPALHTVNFGHIFRHTLSGMVLFRTEILPVFREVTDDETNMIPFLVEMVRHEGILRAALSGNTSFKKGLHFMRAGYLSDYLKNSHKWWQEDFIDSANLDATDEY
ncbi:hypothetical protein PRIPAC_82260, partial [Pristionchus pacificus]|uniref:Uncharacterized protein n=1 Tax=Pristionchus pacificus TaxID=54126 RepID=A0A2A6BWV4_PRIPA